MFAEVAFGKRSACSFESYTDEIVKEREEQGTRLMMATMPEGLCYGVAVYNESGDVIDVNCIIVNGAFEILMGVRVGSLQGKRFFELYSDKFQNGLNYISKAMKSNRYVYERGVCRPHNGRLHLSAG